MVYRSDELYEKLSFIIYKLECNYNVVSLILYVNENNTVKKKKKRNVKCENSIV